MIMKIVSTSRKILMNGLMKGSVKVKDGKKNYTVKYEYSERSGLGFEQFGAPTEVLCFTYKTVENLCFGQ